MIRTLVFLFLAVILGGVILTPGLAALALVVAPLAVVGGAWWLALKIVTHWHPDEAVLRVRHRQLLGPGGPNDPFAGEKLDEDYR